jgi:hypothetical protein
MANLHGAALALVVWYLLAPPPLDADPNRPDTAAPLVQWEQIASFDTLDKCIAQRKQLLSTATGENRIILLTTECITSDDPRLKDAATPAESPASPGSSRPK